MLLIYYLKVIHSGDDRKSSPGAVNLADGVYVLHSARAPVVHSCLEVLASVIVHPDDPDGVSYLDFLPIFIIFTNYLYYK